MAHEELPTRYDPLSVEPKWYSHWESQGYFRADAARAKAHGDPYVVMIPPPNVTGTLHMGHACRTAFEDTLTRYARMQGREALWLPGMDHAGIATQLVVSRLIEAEGQTTREGMGREAFVGRVWEWKSHSGSRIFEQLRRLGASCDWSRECFTLDDDYAAAVKEAFVRLFQEGLVYRGERLVNWSIASQTAISDLEVEVAEEDGFIYDFAYQVADPVPGGPSELIVSTTRPETVFGDTAVAVHPEDERYQSLIGRQLKHPLLDRTVPVIADAELVDPEFGTGAVKVTPAHDPNDFETGKRHGLPMITVMDAQGLMNEQAGEFAGLERFEARERVIEALDAGSMFRGKRPYRVRLPRSQRTGEVVEPRLSTQWFVRMEPLAKPAIEAVRDGRIEFLPEDWAKTYFHWLENIQDWCVSRQLWWGHPIPAWHCDACGEVTVARDAASRCHACGHESLTQDPDVLDTWFSSSLWPFATLGWPDATEVLEAFYPGSDLETGYDIIFFWVARMIMMGLHFMGDVPFKRVLLSGLVTDERGEKMSKVKGNVIDPLDVIEGTTLDALLDKAQRNRASKAGLKYLRETYPEGFAACGADALRLTLLSYSPQTRRIALSLKRVEGYRNFCNKLWNATRLVLSLIGDRSVSLESKPTQSQATRWIRSRFASVATEVHDSINDYRLDQGVQSLYHFVWDEFCDWFLEMAKGPLRREDEVADEFAATLVWVLDGVCRLGHPLMPFITEEIWQRLPGVKEAAGAETLVRAPTPRPELIESAAEWFELVQGATSGIRALRTQLNVDKQARPQVRPAPGFSSSKLSQDVLSDATNTIAELAQVDLNLDPSAATNPGVRDALVTLTGNDVLVVREVIDVDQELARVAKKQARAEKDLGVVRKKLGNPAFVEKAPAQVVQQEREREAALSAEVETYLQRQKELQGAAQT